ncbi:MAG: ROK family protein [Acidimicrobiales bacterium]
MLAVDIGGTKLASAVVTPSGTVVARQRRDTVAPDGEALFEVLAELLSATLGVFRATEGDAAAVSVIGVGCGGPMAPGGETVSPLNIAPWRLFPLRSRLTDRFGLPVFVDNDAKALTRAEGWLGAAQGERNYLARVVSTGVGAGIVVDGRLLEGASGNAGHIGHVVVEPDGRPCACGGRGCLEAEASGPSIAALTGAPAAQAPLEVRQRTGRLVGRAVASVVNLLDLRLALVGGSVALGFGQPFLDAANQELALRSRISYAVGARIALVGLGADGPLVGAAAVGRHGLGLP